MGAEINNSDSDSNSDELIMKGLPEGSTVDCRQCNGKESPSYGGWRSDIECKGLSLFYSGILY